ncbi:NTF2-related export protein [Anopheles marshallii]|uniref:NTF2-related export protein n=1 Tax=Anopheles marshallii TaxID=1521116 RepID=UPI00237B4A47|nr:NTF2-related export protein [Anopheles marshallii]
MASAKVDTEMRSKIDTVCTTAEAFVKLYYDHVDKKRQHMGPLYMDTGLLVWNGNGAKGKEEIQKYFHDLPRSEHTVISIDAQPIVDDAVSSQLTFVMQVAGMVKFHEHPAKPFQQTFMITAQGDKWKIVSDCFRLQDGIL